ncbi:uncharacterized protein OGAPODRAFT_91557 [Ogataea polymorpha]|uniref:uncharacterized protein n=1 Tax=Ogataea polymorpha TaxID=460523 RepID=UPI0007F52EA7|nr:uncharacterized protein OGAPODRAFT_91557 [Ogataea polymorpha]OBA14018.1 hypothetical protein OGAPODRAFT_91557 [Ogataea polymorpha]
MRDIIVFSGSSNPELTDRICRNLGLPPGKVELKKFANGETSVHFGDSVREKDVFIVQSGAGHVNDLFMQLLIMISACKMASAKRITVVCPLFFYSRQVESQASKRGVPGGAQHRGSKVPDSVPHTGSSLKTLRTNEASIANPTGYRSWIAQSGTLIANLLTSAGANHIITMDLHDAQFQGFFDIPVDNLLSKPLFQHYITNYVPNYKDCVIVSPDSGGAKRAAALADTLCMPFALIHKERRQKVDTAQSELMQYVATTMLVGDVHDKVCVVVDDLADTSNTITRAASLLKDQGAKYVYALITHGIFSGEAMRKLKESQIDKIITTNSVDQAAHVAELDAKEMVILDVSRILSEAIRRINNGESVSMLYDHGW